MITTLENLTETVKENNFMELAKWIIQYSRFKFKSAMNYAPTGYKESTLQLYMQMGMRYFNENYRLRNYENLYAALTLQRKKYQPLTPSKNDEKKVYKRTDKAYAKFATPPVAKLDIVKSPVCSKFIYGLQFGDEIKVFDKEEHARFFNKGLVYAGAQTGKLVTVELGEI